MEYLKIFFALCVAFIMTVVLLLDDKLKRIIFKEPNGSVESKMPAQLLPEKGQNGDVELKNEGDEKWTKIKDAILVVLLPSTLAQKLLPKGRIPEDSIPATTSNVFAATTSNGTQSHSSQGKNGIATGRNNEVIGIGGIGETRMISSFKNIEDIDISGGGSPSLDGGVPKNVVTGIGGIGQTKIEDAFENIKSLKISGP